MLKLWLRLWRELDYHLWLLKFLLLVFWQKCHLHGKSFLWFVFILCDVGTLHITPGVMRILVAKETHCKTASNDKKNLWNFPYIRYQLRPFIAHVQKDCNRSEISKIQKIYYRIVNASIMLYLIYDLRAWDEANNGDEPTHSLFP